MLGPSSRVTDRDSAMNADMPTSEELLDPARHRDDDTLVKR